MAQIKYKETQRLRQWDLMLLIGTLITLGIMGLVQVLKSAEPNRNLLLGMALVILILSGLFYYFNSIRLIARYNEKNIKLSMLPVGTVKRKIKWEDVASSEIVELPSESKLHEWNSMLSSLTTVTSRIGNTCLHLTMKDNEEINIGCSNPKELQAFVQNIKEYHPDL
ncbi:MAG: hypothetical protein IPP15_08885 [Saprospiraceae bacterium]|uniref:PH domain-containing protein n=1 Tax=Candidatus Opimibacter skivensis TaxID=2982028 RepID=A0A9D7XPZ3_9BACT|nr:hypothetical protein [Candidatus Opimibacter skivensis]